MQIAINNENFDRCLYDACVLGVLKGGSSGKANK